MIQTIKIKQYGNFIVKEELKIFHIGVLKSYTQ